MLFFYFRRAVTAGDAAVQMQQFIFVAGDILEAQALRMTKVQKIKGLGDVGQFHANPVPRHLVRGQHGAHPRRSRDTQAVPAFPGKDRPGFQESTT